MEEEKEPNIFALKVMIRDLLPLKKWQDLQGRQAENHEFLELELSWIGWSTNS